LQFTTRILAEAHKNCTRDLVLFDKSVFRDVPLSKTEKEIFEEIREYKKKMDLKEQAKQLIMVGDGKHEEINMNSLKVTCHKLHRERVVKLTC
jgi:soluble P-type ATPase